MKRQIIQIDEAKCNGCGLCADACHEEAIGIIDGKAKLLHDDYCDGLGNCLPVCPSGAISFIEREASPYDEEAVNRNKSENKLHDGRSDTESRPTVSERRQWPVQIKLVPVKAPFFDGANLLIAADCTAYTRAGFYEEFIRGKALLIGCPKLDDVDYTEKLTAILSGNDIQSLTVVRMEVPCCGGIELAATEALRNSGKDIPWQVITIGIDGMIRDL